MIKRSEFEELVKKAIESLPQEFAQKIENVAIVIEDFPNFRQLTQLGLRSPYHLFGLYEGVPKTKRTINYSLVPPDKITIFYAPIVFFYRQKDQIAQKVKETIMHEIGHHFGLTEEDLQKK